MNYSFIFIIYPNIDVTLTSVVSSRYSNPYRYNLRHGNEVFIACDEMVKLSAKYLVRRNKANKYFLVRKKDDTDEQFLNRITHLPLQNQFIEQILKISDCNNVKVLYLQNNLLKTVENLDSFPNLTHLYLQRNFLVKIENVNVLPHLKKIYLGYNEIQVLEGMDRLKEIKEIHLENQDLPPGDTLYFEPLTIQNLGTTLHVLNISKNYLTSIHVLKPIKSLKILIANDNCLFDIDDITTTINEWHFLQELSLAGNDVTKVRWYRDSIIFASQSLEILDNVAIHENTRSFVQKLFKQKNILSSKDKTKKEDESKKPKRKVLKFVDDVDPKECCFEFIESFPPCEPIYLHPPWKLRTNVNSVNPNTLLPRPYWKKGAMKPKHKSPILNPET